MAPICIAALRQTAPEKVTVVLEGGEELKTTLNVVTDLRLYAGRELDSEELSALRAAASRARTRARALELLSRRAMSEKELCDKLVQKGEDEHAAAETVAWLVQNRLLDDESYAAAVARHYAERGYGAARIRQELQRRGLDRALWDAAMGQAQTGHDKLDRLIAARLKDPEDRDQVRKVTAALYRRGFGWDEIREALARFRAEVEEEPL